MGEKGRALHHSFPFQLFVSLPLWSWGEDQLSFREPLNVLSFREPGTCPRNLSSAVGYSIFPALRMRRLSLRVSEEEGQMAEAPGGQEWEEQKKGWEAEAWLPPQGWRF